MNMLKIVSALSALAVLCLLAATPNQLAGQDINERIQSVDQGNDKLQLERAVVVAETGKGHPRVKPHDQKLEAYRRLARAYGVDPVHLRSGAEKLRNIDVDSIDDGQLRKLVGILIDRIIDLEIDVHALKHPAPQLHMLHK